MKRATPLKAWAIVEEDGKLVCFDYRLPITWLRRLAVRDRKDKCFPEHDRIVRVEIREIVTKRKRQRVASSAK